MCPNWDNDSSSEPVPCLIVGAGLAGLTAAARLSAAGIQAPILEAQHIPGGRLATLVDLSQGPQPAVFDHGAQFFTVREESFAAMVQTWLAKGVVVEWSRGFATADGSYYADGHPRYRATRGMAALGSYLAQGLDLHLNQAVVSLKAEAGLWRLATATGALWSARSLILTPPAPESLALLAAGSVPLPEPTRKALARITYEPCIAVMVQLDGPSQLPEPGGMWPVGEPLAWMADNHLKGISAAPGAVTLHAGPEFSQSFWDAPDDEVVRRLVEAAAPWLSAAVKRSHVRRWRHSKPAWTHPQRALVCSEPAPLILAGDAFAGPRVEGAVLSGLAAAEHLLT
ncbi:MAG: NAD(P)/FAD-dependent oxidoreductase [Candidatus Promineifilaceae bacterium]